MLLLLQVNRCAIMLLLQVTSEAFFGRLVVLVVVLVVLYGGRESDWGEDGRS